LVKLKIISTNYVTYTRASSSRADLKNNLKSECKTVSDLALNSVKTVRTTVVPWVLECIYQFPLDDAVYVLSLLKWHLFGDFPTKLSFYRKNIESCWV
jgi:hypothetical protein